MLEDVVDERLDGGVFGAREKCCACTQLDTIVNGAWAWGSELLS
jgi:hypothetical protein